MKKNVFKLKAGLSLVLTLMAGQLQASVSITEIMQSNFGGVLDYYNEFPDSWVEIYNTGDEAIDLKGFYISEDNNIDSAYVIPESFVVPSKGYSLIYCDNENKKEHTNFKLNSDKPGTIYIWDNNGVMQDSMHFPEMISPEVSFGRLPDDPDSLSHFRISTPGTANNNTNTERVLKKVDFSVDGGVKKTPFYLKLSLKGDCPKDAVIRYTTNGKEPDSSSNIFEDSIYIAKNTVIRAKSFSDSAISKISKTQTYIFDKDDKMPIISISCDESYLKSEDIGIFSHSTDYCNSHRDNPPNREWIGSYNFLYNWRRPINVEYYPGDSSESAFNQLSETRVSGNVSRTNAAQLSMVVYANKRFGDKYFKGTFWRHLKPNANKQKSMTIRSYCSTDETLAIRDMLSQTAIGKVAKFYDVDFQAKRNVQFFINGRFKQIMHLQERDDNHFIWANHNKISDVECLETFDYIYEEAYFDSTQFPNYANFKKTFRSPDCTYQQMTEVLDINEFMNYVSTQAYFSNVDFPYNNVALWYDKQGTKKWRWILKDLDATIHDPEYTYYNFLLREEPFDDYNFSNSEEACEIYQRMFSFEKFRQPYIDRTCVLSGTAFSHKTLSNMLDSIAAEVTMVLTAKKVKGYVESLEDIYDWCRDRYYYYNHDMSRFFGLGDTIRLRIRPAQYDSMIYFNNNPLIGDGFDGYFFENRDIYLTHNSNLDIYGLEIHDTDEIQYLDLGEMKKTDNPSSTRWTVAYDLYGKHIVEHYTNDALHYKIPTGAGNVFITDGYIGGDVITVDPTITSRAPESLTYMVYSVGGMLVGKFNLAELQNFKQNDEINIVVVLDTNGCKVYSFKLLKE